MSRIFKTLLLLVSMLLGIPGFVEAQSGEGWSLSGDVLTITSNFPKFERNELGQTWDELYADQVTKIVFGDGVTIVSDDYGAWTIFGSSFKKLTTVVVGKNVEQLGVGKVSTGSQHVFSSCENLTTVEFETPSKLKTIGANAFFNATKLQAISLPPSLEEIGDGAFDQCKELAQINLEETALRRLGKSVFDSWKLINVKLPATVETIDELAFSNCRGLKSVTIEGESPALKTIGKGAFMDCFAIEEVPMIPAAQTVIGESTFFQCKALKAVQFAPGSRLEKIEDASRYGVFAYSGIEHISFPKGLKYIGKEAFGYCESLLSVEFEEGSVLENIADAAFCRSALQDIVLPTTVKEIGARAFTEAKLEEIDFPDSLVSIGDQAFSGNLFEHIDVPASLKTLGSGAFQDCVNLKTATFRGSEAPECTGSNAFFGGSNNLTDIFVPVGAEEYKSLFLLYADKLRFTLPGEPSEPEAPEDLKLRGDASYQLIYDAEKGWMYEAADGATLAFTGKLTGITTGDVVVTIPDGEYTLVFQSCSMGSLIVQSNTGSLWVEGQVLVDKVSGNIHMKSGSHIQAPSGKGEVTLTEPAEGGSYTAFAFAQAFKTGRRLPVGTYVSFKINPEEGYELDTALFGKESMKETLWQGIIYHTITEADSDLTVKITFKKAEEVTNTPLDLAQVAGSVAVTYEDNNWYYQEAGKEKVPFTGEVTGVNADLVLLAENIPADAPALQFVEGCKVGSLVVSEGNSLQVDGSVSVGTVSGDIAAGETATIAPSGDVAPVETPDREQEGGHYEVKAFGGQVIEDNTQLPAGTILSFAITIQDGYELASATIGGTPLKESLNLLSTRAASASVNLYYEITGEEEDLTVEISFHKTEPEEPEIPVDPDPISYYNIYVEDVCDGVEVSTSKNVVREGNSVSVYVEKDTARYTFDNFKVYCKRGYYGYWEELKESTQPGEYPINNIWTDIYIKAEGAEEKEDPTGLESIEGVKVYTKDGSLYVQTPQREQVIIVSMSGAVVKNEEQIGLKQYHGLQPGIYIVRVGDKAYKVRLN